MATDVPPERHCATIVLRLTGAAKDLAEELTPANLQNGGLIPAVDNMGNVTQEQVNAVTYLMHQLQTRFGPLDEETRLKAVHEWNTFRRRPNESISATLTRFEQTQMRAEHDAGIVQPYETTSYKLLQTLGFNDKEIIEYIKPFGYKMPNTREEYSSMCLDIRRQLRLIEHHPGNIGSYLRGPSFFVDNSDPATSSATQSSNYYSDASNHQTSFYQADPYSNYTSYSYNVHEEDSSVETSSCTSSDQGEEQLLDDNGTLNFDPIPSSDPAYGEKVYMAYTRARKAWRRFSQKPIRKVRRFFKRKGKGRGKQLRHYLASTDEPDIQAFFQRFNRQYNGKSSGKGSRKGKHNIIQRLGASKGAKNNNQTYFGKFRAKNPTGRDGEIMLCYNCGSDTHLAKDCKVPKGKGKTPNFYTQPADYNSATSQQPQYAATETSLFQQPTQKEQPSSTFYQSQTSHHTNTPEQSQANHYYQAPHVIAPLQLYTQTEDPALNTDDPLASIVFGVRQHFMIQTHEHHIPGQNTEDDPTEDPLLHMNHKIPNQTTEDNPTEDPLLHMVFGNPNYTEQSYMINEAGVPVDPLQTACPWTDALSNRDDQSVTSAALRREECQSPAQYDSSQFGYSPWSNYQVIHSNYNYSINSQQFTPTQHNIWQPTPSIFDPLPQGALLTQECIQERQRQQTTNASIFQNPIHSSADRQQHESALPRLDSFTTYNQQEPTTKHSFFPACEVKLNECPTTTQPGHSTSSDADTAPVFTPTSIFDQQYTNPKQANVRPTNYQIKTTTQHKRTNVQAKHARTRKNK